MKSNFRLVGICMGLVMLLAILIQLHSLLSWIAYYTFCFYFGSFLYRNFKDSNPPAKSIIGIGSIVYHRFLSNPFLVVDNDCRGNDTGEEWLITLDCALEEYKRGMITIAPLASEVYNSMDNFT